MRLSRIVAFVSLMLIAPATARASWWDWLQEMSGPGPFDGRGNVLATVCSRDPTSKDPVIFGVSNDRKVESNWGDKRPCWFLDLRQLAYDANEHQGRFPAAVNLTTHEFGLTWQLFPHRPVEIGFGGGIAHFSGVKDASVNRFILTVPRLEAAPLVLGAMLVAKLMDKAVPEKRWLRLMKVHIEQVWIPGTLQAEDFGVARGTGTDQSTWSTTGEHLGSGGVFIDLGELFRR